MLRLVRRRRFLEGPSRRSNHIRAHPAVKGNAPRAAETVGTDGEDRGTSKEAPPPRRVPATASTAGRRPPSAFVERQALRGEVEGAAKSLSDFITERFDEFSRSQKDVARYIVDHLDEAAFQTAEELARRANTSSSTVVRFSQALGFEGYPELQQSAIEEYRQPRRARAATAAAQLFDFDHSEFEASLGADHANVEETARSLTREQVEACVSALASAQPRGHRRRRPDGLLRQLPAPPARAARHPRRGRRQPAPGRRSAASAGSTRTRSSSPSRPAAPIRSSSGR